MITVTVGGRLFLLVFLAPPLTALAGWLTIRQAPQRRRSAALVVALVTVVAVIAMAALEYVAVKELASLGTSDRPDPALRPDERIRVALFACAPALVIVALAGITLVLRRWWLACATAVAGPLVLVVGPAILLLSVAVN